MLHYNLTGFQTLTCLMKHAILFLLFFTPLILPAQQGRTFADGNETRIIATHINLFGKWNLDSATTDYQLFYQRSIDESNEIKQINHLKLNITDTGFFELEYYFSDPKEYCHYWEPDYFCGEYKITCDTFVISDKHFAIPYVFVADFKISMPDSNHLVLKRLNLNPETYPYFYEGFYRDDFTDLAYEQQINIIANDGMDFKWVEESDSSYLILLWTDTAFEIINSLSTQSTIIREIYHGENFEYQLSELKLGNDFKQQDNFIIELPAEIYIWKQGAIFHCRFKNQEDDNSFYLVYNLRMY